MYTCHMRTHALLLSSCNALRDPSSVVFFLRLFQRIGELTQCHSHGDLAQSAERLDRIEEILTEPARAHQVALP